MTNIYRKIEEKEIPLLKEFLYEALFVPPGRDKFPRSILDEPNIAKYIANWGAKNDLAFVAIQNGQIVAAIWGRIFSEENKGYGFVNEQTAEISMAVLVGYRNQGIGTKLLASLEAAYRKLGIKCLSLSVNKLNPARHLYERNAYELYSENGTAMTLVKLL